MGTSTSNHSNIYLIVSNIHFYKEHNVNEKKAKAIRKQVGYHPTDPRGYKQGGNSRKEGSTGTVTATGSRGTYNQAKKLAEQINERHTA